MKFTKFGKALLLSALSVGVGLGITSCVQSYSVGYLYVTGTETSGTPGAGIISGFKIDHNTGKLSKINGLPISSGGANPDRAVLTAQQRFVYVLNRGASTNPAGTNFCTPTYPCVGSNITQFAVGGNGVLTYQETFYSQGVNPFKLMTDATGTYLMVLDHDSPDNAAPNSNDGCARALNGVTTCGDITVFEINQTTGRLSLVPNAQVTSSGGSALTYFPVPSNPVDFVQTGSYILIMSGNSFSYDTTTGLYNGGATVFPYGYTGSTGQLQTTANTSQPLGVSVTHGTSMLYTFNVLYITANDPITLTFNGTNTTAYSQIIPYTIGATGSLQAEATGTLPDDPTLSDPVALMEDSKGRFIYVANEGNNTSGANPQSGISGYFVETMPTYQVTFIPDEPFGSGAGPQCIVEDPSNQFIYEADYNDSLVTGRVIDPNSGVLNPMRVTSSFALPGPATWCLVDGRTF
jgi:hypothetical protein